MQDVEFGRPSFRWDDIRVVLAVKRAGTMSAAAAALGVNASTIGRRLDALEAELGARLFERTPDGALPTHALEQLLPAAQDLEHAAADIVRATEGFEREPEGLVRITAPPGVAQLSLAPRLPALLKAYPKLRVQIDATIGYADLSRREADLALRVERPRTGDLVSLRVALSVPAVIGSRRYVKRLRCLQDPNDARWIDWGPDLAHILPSQWVRAHVRAEQVVLQTSSMATQVEAARAGLGLMLSSRDVAESAGLALMPLSPPLQAELDAAPTSALWMVGHRAMRNVPRVAAVWNFVSDAARSSGLARPD